MKKTLLLFWEKKREGVAMPETVLRLRFCFDFIDERDRERCIAHRVHKRTGRVQR